MKRYPIFFLLIVALGGCLQYSTDSQGHLNSIGIPGAPVWSTQPNRSASESREPRSDGELAADATGPAPWLVRLNRWRTMAGLNRLGANSELNNGSLAHARYLVEQGPAEAREFLDYTRTIGAAMHREDPASRWSTNAGEAAARGGTLAPGVMQTAEVIWNESGAAAEIDTLIKAPFHRFSLLAPWAVVAGYGSFGQAPRRAAALALRGPQNDAATVVEFPPAGSTLSGAMTAPEWPDPLTACPGYQLPVGLPVTLQLGYRHPVELQSYSFVDRTDHSRLDACAFAAATYRSRDPAEQESGRKTLKDYGAVILIPRAPLRDGQEYLVSITIAGQLYRWSFGNRKKPGGQVSSLREPRLPDSPGSVPVSLTGSTLP
jgi:hypothetical protein